mgnify:CR=1 FL=1
MRNIDKFLIELKELNFPPEDYLIVSSGPLAIHGIRECGDLDILISDRLFNDLSKKYHVEVGAHVSKISFEHIECMHRNFAQNDKYDFNHQRANAEIINGIPFQDLKTCLFFKQKSEREKDKNDVKLILNYLDKKTS